MSSDRKSISKEKQRKSTKNAKLTPEEIQEFKEKYSESLISTMKEINEVSHKLINHYKKIPHLEYENQKLHNKLSLCAMVIENRKKKENKEKLKEEVREYENEIKSHKLKPEEYSSIASQRLESENSVEINTKEKNDKSTYSSKIGGLKDNQSFKSHITPQNYEPEEVHILHEVEDEEVEGRLEEESVNIDVEKSNKRISRQSIGSVGMNTAKNFFQDISGGVIEVINKKENEKVELPKKIDVKKTNSVQNEIEIEVEVPEIIVKKESNKKQQSNFSFSDESKNYFNSNKSSNSDTKGASKFDSKKGLIQPKIDSKRNSKNVKESSSKDIINYNSKQSNSSNPSLLSSKQESIPYDSNNTMSFRDSDRNLVKVEAKIPQIEFKNQQKSENPIFQPVEVQISNENTKKRLSNADNSKRDSKNENASKIFKKDIREEQKQLMNMEQDIKNKLDQLKDQIIKKKGSANTSIPILNEDFNKKKKNENKIAAPNSIPTQRNTLTQETPASSARKTQIEDLKNKENNLREALNMINNQGLLSVSVSGSALLPSNSKNPSKINPQNLAMPQQQIIKNSMHGNDSFRRPVFDEGKIEKTDFKTLQSRKTDMPVVNLEPYQKKKSILKFRNDDDEALRHRNSKESNHQNQNDNEDGKNRTHSDDTHEHHYANKAIIRLKNKKNKEVTPERKDFENKINLLQQHMEGKMQGIPANPSLNINIKTQPEEEIERKVVAKNKNKQNLMKFN